jgi:hypothetical protein
MTGTVASWVMRLIWAPRPFGIGQGDDPAVVHDRPQSQYVAVETLGRLQRRTAEIRDDSANTHIVILPSRFDAAAAAGRIVPEADGRVVCSLRPWPSPITTETANRYVRGCGRVGCQIQPRERASWTASWRLAAPSLAAAEER